MVRVGLNGYGRIGRCFHRQVLETDIDVVAINKSSKFQPELLKYDSVYGTLDANVSIDNEGYLVVNNKKTILYREKEIHDILWPDVDVVIDSTGKFKDYSELEMHKAKKVILTAPPRGNTIKQFVMGVNEQDYCGERIISNASCTTNALAPLLKVISDSIGIEEVYFTTVHSVTSSQNILDNSHKDVRRARAAYESMIPTTTGAAKAVEQILPFMKGKIHGQAVRVPTSTVSMLDITMMLKEEVDILDLLEKHPMDIVRICHEPLVSIDFKGDKHSCIVDAEFTKSYGKTAKIIAWYDNEYGYTARLVDLVKHIT